MKDTKTKYSIATNSSDATYQISQLLLNNKFRSLSSNAKILYMLFVDRHNVSLKDGLVDAEGNVFFIMLREEMGELLSLSRPTITKTISELIENNLMVEIRQGLSKPNLLYLLTSSIDTTLNERNL